MKGEVDLKNQVLSREEFDPGELILARRAVTLAAKRRKAR